MAWMCKVGMACMASYNALFDRPGPGLPGAAVVMRYITCMRLCVWIDKCPPLPVRAQPCRKACACACRTTCAGILERLQNVVACGSGGGGQSCTQENLLGCCTEATAPMPHGMHVGSHVRIGCIGWLHGGAAILPSMARWQRTRAARLCLLMAWEYTSAAQGREGLPGCWVGPWLDTTQR
jgi:hypothetical protein